MNTLKENLAGWIGIDINKDSNKSLLLDITIANAKEFASNYCNRDYIPEMDLVIFKMVVEDYNRRGSEGITSTNFGGVSEAISADYSPSIYKQLNAFKKIRVGRM